MGCIVDPVNHEPVNARLTDGLANDPFEVVQVMQSKGNGYGTGKTVAQVGVRFVPIGIGANAEIAHDTNARAVA
ncbi:MAG: hypothetical protein BWY09_02390 [Candidatus Hydrogenedentes bacterium ADurb.Bin179]|nr:MAG: hypothetical protein BWY09_02390 [Candidatus Hydrogenedentes bacterium ADurb.Bin179]